MKIVINALFAITNLAVFSTCLNDSEPSVQKRLVGGIPVEANSSVIVKVVATRGPWDKNCAGAVVHREYVLTHAYCLADAEKVHVFINNLASSRKMAATRNEIPILDEAGSLEEIIGNETDFTLRSYRHRKHNTKHPKGPKGKKPQHPKGKKPHDGKKDDDKDEGKQQMKVEKEVKHNHSVFIHQITSQHIIYEIVLKPEDVVISPSWILTRRSKLALLKIPSKEYTQEVITLCSEERLNQISEKIGSAALSWVGLVGYGALATGSLMHGFFGSWPEGHYAKFVGNFGQFMYTNSSTVRAARGDMGGVAFFGQTDFCLGGVIMDFLKGANLTRIVRISSKAAWISNVTGIKL